MQPTTGIKQLDGLLGGLLPGDNVVWEVDSGAPADLFVCSFLDSCEKAGLPVVYVSFNRSPQTVTTRYGELLAPERFHLVDCFSSGKGNGDTIFLDFFRSESRLDRCRALHVAEPSAPAKLQQALIALQDQAAATARYVFDSLTGMLDLWGDEEQVLRFFGHFCPRLFDLSTIAYWLLETGGHSDSFLAKVRHITQLVLEVDVTSGTHSLTILKASGRPCTEIGVRRPFSIADDGLHMADESRSDRELVLLTRMSDALGSALTPHAFFDRTMEALAREFGMTRGALMLLDRATNRLRVAAAHGMSDAERGRVEAEAATGVMAEVMRTGTARAVPDPDSRGSDRETPPPECPGSTRIHLPLTVDNDRVGILTVERPFAVQATVKKDLRLLTIVASITSQVIKINSIVRVEKDALIVRDRQLMHELRSRYRLDNVTGQSAAIQRVLATAAMAAKSTAAVLVTGETGTGKELVANVVHYNSGRAGGPLVKVNCGALPEQLLDSELFGHVKGAFTGAVKDRKGRFELGHGGTLFLDEVGEMSPRLQVKLLHVLQDMAFEPVGSMRTVRVDVRVVAATNKNLKNEIKAGRFREDLYYRLNVIPIHLPPLRERRDDIPLLVDHFLEMYNRANRKEVTQLSRDVLDLLVAYDWPGNVRELENCIERAVVMSPGNVLTRALLPAEILTGGESRRQGSMQPSVSLTHLRDLIHRICTERPDLASAYHEVMNATEGSLLGFALDTGFSQRQLAEHLGMSRTTLRKKLRSLQVRQ